MALWNHLVPDLVELSVQEREVDKLPHSKVRISLLDVEVKKIAFKVKSDKTFFRTFRKLYFTIMVDRTKN